MVKLFRKIRQSSLQESKTVKYLKYALGEIFLVVIGILLALQINTWNEEKKARNEEQYVLHEIRNNLTADLGQIEEILAQRTKTQVSSERMNEYLRTADIDKDTFSYDLGQLFTFERYFPIRTAYEVSKVKGLPISNAQLRTQIANYYEHDQYKVQSSIEDIENVFLNDFQFGFEEYLTGLVHGEKAIFLKYPNPQLNRWVLKKMNTFLINNYNTKKKVEKFREHAKALLQSVDTELSKF